MDKSIIRPSLPLAATLGCLPYVLVYFKNLWQLSHYQFFPLILLVVGYLGYTRWDGNLKAPSWFARLLLPFGALACVSGTLFASPWATYLGFVISLASWLGHQRDKEGGGSLSYLAIPMLLIWQPPYSSTVTGDTILIQQLQLVSAKFSSRLLDMLGYIHFQPGTILEIAGRSFGVAEACSGIQSFFAVLSVGAILIALQKRGPLHALLLLGTSPFWAVLMNTIRITLIPIAHTNFGIDLASGLPHELLGYITMILAVGLMISTDELLVGLMRFLPATPIKFSGYFKSISLPEIFLKFGKAACLVMVGGCSLLQLWDVQASWGKNQQTVDFFRNLEPVSLFVADGPESLGGWARLDYQQVNRDHDVADLGERSDSWQFDAPFGVAAVSFDQMFPGWHELTRCYRSGGWKLESRRILSREADPWPVVEASFSRQGEKGYLLFSLVNRAGRFLDPPEDWNRWSSLRERLQNRLTPAVRGTLFGVSAYQMQIFVGTSSSLNESDKADVQQRFREIRNQLWDAAKRRIDSE